MLLLRSSFSFIISDWLSSLVSISSACSLSSSNTDVSSVASLGGVRVSYMSSPWDLKFSGGTSDLWALPMCIFKPWLVSNLLSHCSHLKSLIFWGVLVFCWVVSFSEKTSWAAASTFFLIYSSFLLAFPIQVLGLIFFLTFSMAQGFLSSMVVRVKMYTD